MRSSSMLPYFFARRGYLRTSALSSRCYTTSFVVLALLAPHPFWATATATATADSDGDCGWRFQKKRNQSPPAPPPFLRY